MKVRRHKIKGFTIVSNKMLQDKNLSHKAKGLMAQMYSYPDDWVFSIAGLVTQSKEGEKGIKATLIELEKAGYLKRTPVRDERGLFTEMEYDLYPEPITDNPSASNPSADFRPSDSEGQTNINKTNNQITNKEYISLTGDIKERATSHTQNMAYQHIVDLYHQLCPSLPKVAKLTPERERAIKARLKEFNHDEFITAFKKAEASAFLKGANGGWKANFDFIMRAGSMVKILEGQYDKLHLNGKGTPNPYDMAEYNDLPF